MGPGPWPKWPGPQLDAYGSSEYFNHIPRQQISRSTSLSKSKWAQIWVHVWIQNWTHIYWPSLDQKSKQAKKFSRLAIWSFGPYGPFNWPLLRSCEACTPADPCRKLSRSNKTLLQLELLLTLMDAMAVSASTAQLVFKSCLLKSDCESCESGVAVLTCTKLHMAYLGGFLS